MKHLALKLPVILLFLGLASCQKFSPDKEKNITPTDFLTSTDYTKLDVEIVYVQGSPPNQDALNELDAFLEARLHKPDGITISSKEINDPENHTYSVSDITAVEEKERTLTSNREDGVLTAFIFYANADYAGNSGNSKVLGVQYAPTSMALFKSTIDEYSGGLGQPSTHKLEGTVLIHEFGHTLGLVNVGTPMTQDHEDPNHSGHCDNSNCIMHHTVENSGFADLLFGGDIPELDSQCISDLQALGGK